MSHYQIALEATEEHLRSLKSGGVRFLNVKAETLFALQQPVPEEMVNSSSSARVTEAGEFRIENRPAALTEGVTEKTEPVTRVESSVTAAEVTMTREQKEAAMAALRARALVCQKCPHLVQTRHTVVFGVGDIHAPLMFVGEAPGADEDRLGEPFVGAAGQLLTKIIKAMGFSRETVYIANILKCRPDTPGQTSGNRKPTPEEMKTCLPYLQEQIDLIKPRVMVALGATAVEGLLGKGEGITRLRGRFQTYRDIPIMPTFHPSYLLHNSALTEKRKVWEDMLQVLEKLGAPISQKQRDFFLKGQ